MNRQVESVFSIMNITSKTSKLQTCTLRIGGGHMRNQVGSGVATSGRSPKPRSRKRRALRRELTAWSFVLPSLIGLGIFVYGSLIYSMYISFTNWDLLTPPKWVGLANYSRAFRDPNFIQCMGNTLYFVVAIVPLGIILAMAMAIALNKERPGFKFFRGAYYMPSILIDPKINHAT